MRVGRWRNGSRYRTRRRAVNLAAAAAFMDDEKCILVFSDAGGTGRATTPTSGAKNQRLRVHYLLEPGWEVDAAIQGLGRTWSSLWRALLELLHDAADSG